ncbi:VWA domain-containing protein [Candidatus Igneacidithiobacillus taiwanensis]|uniref:nitric oxide reductase activation protein NorD n=1 Tax=Candidatus Igneacidithiobacillus taiwanensis TaxID=1945924 RepID=UPI002898BD8E|nr:VWA domain-containing protein [Candidatus Igneacidithiobacillus taiwanensis]
MSAATEEILEHLDAVSFVAGRDAREALPAVTPLGEAASLRYLEAGRDLFFYDREAGKAFFHATPALVQSFGGLDPWLEQARVFLTQRGTFRAAVGFFEQAALVRKDYGLEGEKIWYEEGAAWVGRHVDSAAAYFRMPVARLFGTFSAADLRTLLAPARELAKGRLGLASYLEGAVKVRALCGLAGVEDWATRGRDILAAGRIRGEAWFRLESDEARGFLLEVLPGFRTGPHKRLFALLLQAWTGLHLPFEDGDWNVEGGRSFLETDGRSLFVPAVMPDREEAILAFYHTGAHLAFGSYDEAAIRALFREIGSEHPPLDADQRITWRPLFAQFGADLLRFQLIFDQLEDLRVDLAMEREMPGYLARLLRAARAQTPPPGAAGAYWREALQLTEAAAAGRLPPALAALASESVGIVDAFRLALERYASTDLPPITLAERAAAFLPGHSPNAARPVYPRKSSRTEAVEMDAGGQLGAAGHKEKPREAPQQAEGNDPDLEIPPEDIQGTGGRVGVGIPMPAKVHGSGRGVQGPKGGWPYQEWDYRQQKYKENWARVHERQLRERDEAKAVEIAMELDGTMRRLKKALQAQKPTRMAPLRRQKEGEEPDIDAAVQFVVERRAGQSPKANIYRQRRPLQRDTAVLLLADLSTSIMAEAADTGVRVVDRLRAAMLLFGEALVEVGDPFALYGFASKYHQEVLLYPIKRFGERFDGRARALLGGLSGRLATRMGAAIRHSTRQLLRSPGQRRLLLILSDGRPADYDDGGDPRYLQEDTRMAVREAREQGVHAFCISLDPRGGDYLPLVFGQGHYLVLPHIDQLPQRLPEIYLRLRGHG